MSCKTFVLFAALVIGMLSPGEHAQAATNTHATQCGAPIASFVLTNTTAEVGTRNTAFVPIPGARFEFTAPARLTARCYIVKFDASATCGGAAPDNLCYVDVRDNGNPFDPPGGIGFASDSPLLATHSFEWVERVGSGHHVIVVRFRVANPATRFALTGWTMDIEEGN
jgi:hypothetical protein